MSAAGRRRCQMMHSKRELERQAKIAWLQEPTPERFEQEYECQFEDSKKKENEKRPN